MKKDRYEWIKNNISQIGKKNWKLTEAIARNKKDAAIALVCVVLVIVAVVSIVKIVNLHSAEIKQEQEIQALQEEYTSESGDTASMQDESELVKKTDDDLKTESEDDPNAWYHDIDVDFAGLKEQNEDIVGWIYFEDEESISYPLLYSGDDYYLRRNYLKEEETAGSIYIDGNNSPDLDDAHTLIYGHNMRNLSMFGNLKFYKTEEDYFENHRHFQLITETGAYRYEIFAYKDVGTLTGGIYTTWKYVDDDFKKFIEDSICQGSYVDVDIDVDDETHIVTLSTCSYDSDVRFTVSALRIDEHKWNQ
ncbi:class B sortase [Diplocloster agilis]|uniref:class B sortase n=1 Tax=Diplocloster agilis TaxID=2850323 RepID=UPI002265D66B|nr:class B sortase [Suonthocola fibrivorans]MCU6732178.1 class B sortase [Suonthocola fibrivorans]